MIRQLLLWDQEATLWINRLHTMWTDSLMMFVTEKKVWIPLYILLIVLLLQRIGWKRTLVVLGAVALTIFACDQTANLVKAGVARLRPCYNTAMLQGGLHLLEERGYFFGFFSAHAANHFGIACCILQGLRSDRTRPNTGMGIFLILWATLVGISRIFVGKHFLGDVLVGTAVGSLYGLLAGAVALWLITKYLQRKPV